MSLISHRRNTDFRRPTFKLLPLTAAIAVSLSFSAYAAEQEDTESDNKTLSSVTVTARRAAEQAKDVPFGLSVVSGEELEARRLTNMEEALRSVPGVDINSWGGANDTNIRIRGIGSLYQVSADDGSVVVNVDGVALSSRHATLGTLDIERVEVLKGPQGTLFGRNSEAGAINITTRRPTRQLEGYVRGEIGQQGQHLEEFAVGGPLSERFSGRFAVRNSGADNWVENSQDGQPISKLQDLAYRGSMLWDIQPGTSALLVSEHQKIQGRIGLMVLRPYGDPPTNDVPPGEFDGNEKVLDRHSLEVNHDLPGMRLTSVTAYTSADFRAYAGADRAVSQMWTGMPVPIMKTETADERAISQDLRLSSLPDALVFWVAGVNFANSKRSFDMDMPLYMTVNQRNFKTDSQAIYGEVTYPLTDRLKLTGGLRHTWEKKTFDATYDNAGVSSSDRRKLNDDYSTGRVALSYAITPATNIYGVVARGYKAGGFNDNASQIADGVPYKAAVATNIELGFKSESADRRYALNGAIFFNQVKDDHLLGYDPANNFASQAINADTESKGLELEGQWRVGGGFTLTGGLTWLNGKVASDALGVDGGNVYSGNRLPDVPRLSYNFSASYQQGLGDALLGLPSPMLNAKLTWRHVGERAADPQNHFNLDSYDKVDMRIGVASGNTEIYLWGDNLLDERYDLYGYYMTSMVPGNAAFTVGMPSRGRSLGLGAAWYF